MHSVFSNAFHRRSCQAAEFVEELADNIPTYADHGLLGDQKLLFCRKAQVLAGDLCRSLGSRDDRFNFDDVEALHIDSRDHVWAYLCQAGVFSISGDLKEKLKSGEIRECSNEGRLLRAAVICAGWEISNFREGAFSARELGCYIVDVATNTRELVEGYMMSSSGTPAF